MTARPYIAPKTLGCAFRDERAWAIAYGAAATREPSRSVSAIRRVSAIASIAVPTFTVAYFAAEMLRAVAL